MGEAKGVEQKHPRDLLQRFTNSHQHQPQKRYREESDEIELSLGLSLGGRFGVEPRETKLVRSTSISGFTTSTFFRDDDSASTQTQTRGSGSGSVFCSGSGSGSGPVFPLMRTSSLPMVSEEEWRKRKELQTLRRMEAKKKRSEKQQKNNVRLVRDRSSLERNCDDNNNNNSTLPPSFGLPPSGDVAVAAAGQVSGGGSHGGSSSSGVSDFDSRVVPGQGNCSEPRSPSSVQSASMSVPEPNEQKPVIAPTLTDTRTAVSIKVEVESPSKKHGVAENGRRESGMQVMEEMPCVSTKGDGPNGRRIEGFLYQYKKGEEVRIVCVCHGKFLTPAEFVKHAGGGDVSHPLRHIVVSPSPSLL